jgi:signal peptidase II
MRDMQAARGTPLTGPAAAGGQPGAAGASTQGSSGVSGAAQPAANRPRSRQRRRIGILLAVAVAVLALDIVSKALVVAHLANRQIHLLGGFLTLRESRNPGAAFSLGTSLTLMYSAIAVAVIVVILRTSRRIRSLPWAITLGLLLGGATGNLIDRIFRSPGLFRGWVVDWIQVPHWPVFNLADSAIVCGGILAVLLSARGIRLDGRRD